MSDQPSSEIFLFGFGWEGTVSALDRLDIGDKIAETRYFLTRMEEARSFNEFRWDTSAFLGSARLILDWLAWTVHTASAVADKGSHHHGKALDILGEYLKVHVQRGASGKQKLYVWPKHPLLVAMFEKRQETSHRSSLWIAQSKEPAPGEGENVNEHHAFVEPGETILEGKPGTRVLPFCREVHELIRSIKEQVDLL
jgi:hypothetical protein